MEDFIHPHRGDNDATTNSRCPPGKASSRASGHKWDIQAVAELHQGSYLFGGLR